MKIDLEIEGPESIAISPNGKDIYTGIVGGEIVRINEHGKVTVVTKFGQDCGMISLKALNQKPKQTKFHCNIGRFINLQKANGIY